MRALCHAAGLPAHRRRWPAMLIGHYGPAFILARRWPSLPLWALFVAAQAVDFAWDALVLVGVERAHVQPGITASNDLALDWMPWSHSLAASVVWAAACALLWWAWYRHAMPERAAAWPGIALAVASHWWLDLPMHAADLPLLAGDAPRVGLGLWHDRWASVLLEAAVFAGSWWVWQRGVVSPRGLAVLVVGLVVNGLVYFGPAPPVIEQVCLSTLLVYVGMAVLAGRTVGRPRP